MAGDPGVLVHPVGVQVSSKEFIPIDRIRDCVVIENILAHKVTNAVVLRLKDNSRLVALLVNDCYETCLEFKEVISSKLEAILGSAANTETT